MFLLQPKIVQALLLLTGFVAAVTAQPDLVISQINLTRDETGIFVQKVKVTITNTCPGTIAGASYVLVTFRDSERTDAKPLFFSGEVVKSLRGGESQIRIFDVTDKKIVFGRYVIAEADPYKKVPEADENNNWRSLFPDDAGTILSRGKCSK